MKTDIPCPKCKVCYLRHTDMGMWCDNCTWLTPPREPRRADAQIAAEYDKGVHKERSSDRIEAKLDRIIELLEASSD